MPDSDLTVNPATGTGELKVTGLPEYDYNGFIASDSTDWQFDYNAATHPNGFYNATLNFDIKWNGPVTQTDQVKDTANGFAGTYYQNDATVSWDVSSLRPAESGIGNYTFVATASNSANSNSIGGSAFVQLATEQNGVFFPSGASLQADPVNPALTNLVVDGSSNGGVDIDVTAVHGGRDIRVKIDGARQHYQADFPAAAVSRLIVNGGPGDNHIDVANDVRVPALLRGSFGKDHIQAGGGRTIVIGGLGSDHLEAGSGGAVLIGGTTSFDRSLPALDAILNEWARTDESYLQRVANIANMTFSSASPSGGVNGGNYLNASTVQDDGAGNKLEGGPALDWYFASVTDKAKGVKLGEIVIAL